MVSFTYFGIQGYFLVVSAVFSHAYALCVQRPSELTFSSGMVKGLFLVSGMLVSGMLVNTRWVSFLQGKICTCMRNVSPFF